MKLALKFLFLFLIFAKLGLANILPEASNIESQNFFSEYVQTLKNLEIENPPLIISFSATPGMGKSTLAKILEEKFQAVRISSDEVRMLLKKHNLYPKTGSSKIDIVLMESYISYAIDRLSKISKNNMIILDKSIDRDCAIIAKIAKEKNYPFFVIRLELSKDETIERIKTRPDFENYLKYFNKWYGDYQNFDVSCCNYFLDTTLPLDEKKLQDLIQKIEFF